MMIAALSKILLHFLCSVTELILTDNCVPFFIFFIEGKKLQNRRRMGEIIIFHTNTFVHKETQYRNLCSYSKILFAKYHLYDHRFCWYKDFLGG